MRVYMFALLFTTVVFCECVYKASEHINVDMDIKQMRDYESSALATAYVPGPCIERRNPESAKCKHTNTGGADNATMTASAAGNAAITQRATPINFRTKRQQCDNRVSVDDPSMPRKRSKRDATLQRIVAYSIEAGLCCKIWFVTAFNYKLPLYVGTHV